MKSVYLLFLLIVSSAKSYNILVFCPLFGHSHSTFFGRLADILTEAGHNVTMLTPTIVDEFRNYSYTKLSKDIVYLDPSPKLKAIGDLIAGNGRYWTQEFSISEVPQSSRFFKSVALEQHQVLANNLPILDELKKKNFDLILFETIFTCAFPLMDYLEIEAFALAQSIAFEASSLRAVGDPVMPSYTPDIVSQSSDRMTLYERFLNTVNQVVYSYYNFFPDYYVSYDNLSKKIYPMEEMPKASFVFTNSNPYLDFPRATISKNVPIGGISVNIENLRSGKLSEEWDQILNLRTKTILVAFGSVILSKDMPFEYKVSLARAMKQFPDVTFLWKYENDDVESFAEGIENIHFLKWVPQRELLADSRISAFMTHGGLGSVNEVSYLGKPTIMCPIMGDQMRNAKMLARHNGSIEISKYELQNTKIVEEAFRKILYDESYKIASQRLSEQLEFQPVSPKDLFLKHTEFAARVIMSGQFWLALVDTADMIGFTLTFSVNLVLLGLIRTRGKNLGTYKYLMSFFSFFSMFYAIVESILRPIMHIENATFFLISRKRFDYSTRLGKINSAFYCACFATSFVLSAVHFVYRYFAACKPHLLRFFNMPLLLLWPLGCCIPVTAWASVSYFLYPDTDYTETAVTYVLQTHYEGIKKENVSYIAYVYYQYGDGKRHVYIKNLLGCFVHYFVMSMTFVVVFYCGFSTWWTIREHRGASDKTRQLQNQLFKALVLQTLIPSMFMYIPTGVMFIAPFFDVNLNANANFIVFCSFLYPGLDPLILIFIIREFRLTVLNIVKGKSGNNAVGDVYSTSRSKMSQVPVHDLSG